MRILGGKGTPGRLLVMAAIVIGLSGVPALPWTITGCLRARTALATPSESHSAAPLQPLPAPSPPLPASRLGLTSLEIGSGASPISFEEVGSLPLVHAPVALIVADARTHCSDLWLSIGEGSWSVAVPTGYMLKRCTVTVHEGHDVFIDQFRYVVPGAQLEVTKRAVYSAQAPGEILLLETRRTEGTTSVTTRLERQGKLWRYSRTGGEGGDQHRTIDRVDETLEHNEHAFFALLRRGQVKPGAKLSYRWFDPETATDQRDGVQLLGSTSRIVQGQTTVLHRAEQVLQGNRLRAVMILDSAARQLVLMIGGQLRTLQSSEAEAKQGIEKPGKSATRASSRKRSPSAAADQATTEKEPSKSKDQPSLFGWWTRLGTVRKVVFVFCGILGLFLGIVGWILSNQLKRARQSEQDTTTPVEPYRRHDLICSIVVVGALLTMGSLITLSVLKLINLGPDDDVFALSSIASGFVGLTLLFVIFAEKKIPGLEGIPDGISWVRRGGFGRKLARASLITLTVISWLPVAWAILSGRSGSR